MDLVFPELVLVSSYEVGGLLFRGGNLSESEAEMDGPHNEVTLPQEMRGRGNLKAGQSAIR